MRTALRHWSWLVVVLPVWRSSRSYFERCRAWHVDGETLAVSPKLERLLLIVGLLMLSGDSFWSRT